MPAKDAYHDIVVKALKKDGWGVKTKQLYLTIEDRAVWIDIEAEKTDQVIVVEVKGFENLRSPLTYLYSVVGQYMVYREILRYLELDYDIFLAVPRDAHDTILQEELSQIIIKNIGIKMMVVDMLTEEVISWVI